MVIFSFRLLSPVPSNSKMLPLIEKISAICELLYPHGEFLYCKDANQSIIGKGILMYLIVHIFLY